MELIWSVKIGHDIDRLACISTKYLGSFWEVLPLKLHALLVVISDLQISLIFLQNISKWNINNQVSEDSSPRALSNSETTVLVTQS